MIGMKLYKYDDNMNSNDVIHIFNGIIKHIFVCINAFY